MKYTVTISGRPKNQAIDNVVGDINSRLAENMGDESVKIKLLIPIVAYTITLDEVLTEERKKQIKENIASITPPGEFSEVVVEIEEAE